MGKEPAKSDQIIGVADILKGLIPILYRLPHIVKSFLEILKLDENSHESWGTLVEKNAEKYPDRPALKWDDSSMTHLEFNEEVNRCANYFISLGLKKGDVVIVFLENRPELFIAYCAIGKIGAIASMINTNQRENSLLHSINHAPGKFHVIGEEVLDAFMDIEKSVESTGEKIFFFVPDAGKSSCPEGFTDLKKETAGFSAENPSTLQEVQLKDPLAYVYTSGTTGGMPKAAIIVNKRLFAATCWFGKLVQKTVPSDTVYCPLPFFHTNGLSVGWPVAIANGAALAIRRKFSVTNFWDDVRKFNATNFIYIGELPRYLLNQPPKPDDRKNPLKKAVGNGMRPDIWKEFKKRFGVRKIYEFYAAAESPWSFANMLNMDYTVGMNLQTYAIVKCDVDEGIPIRDNNGFMEKVDRGEAGLLLFEISERYRFAGYTDREQTEKKILRDVFATGDMWFNTGDLLRDQGCRHAQFVDRLGDTYRWKGENVSTTEVEEVANIFEQVSMSTAYGVTVPGYDGRAGMISIVANTPLQEFNFNGLAAYFKRALPSYAVPKFIRFREELDSTDTSKIKKVDLKKEAYDPAIVADPLYFLVPGEDTYLPLDDGIYNNIQKVEYKM